MREVKYKEETKTIKVFDEEVVSCDLCGFDEDESYIFEVRIEVGADDCVGTRITRDICQDCYEKKSAGFDALFKYLQAGAEKHQWRIEDQGDRWYG